MGALEISVEVIGRSVECLEGSILTRMGGYELDLEAEWLCGQ